MFTALAAVVLSAGVFDGHGGSMTAAHAADTLHHVPHSTLHAQAGLPRSGACQSALRSAFVQADKQWAEHTRGCAFDGSGSTAVVAVVDKHSLVAANAGELPRRFELHNAGFC
jgi:serine/threonine protein phosphatase PrpC